MFDETTKRPALGQCAVCHRADSVPEDQRDRLPAFCSDACKTGWLELRDITSPATHEVVDFQWVKVGPQMLPDRSSTSYHPQRPTHVEPVDPPRTPLPAVDLVVAEAGPPITPVTAAELEACRRDKPAPRPVPGQWLRNVLAGVFR
jgi:hypothetical protein